MDNKEYEKELTTLLLTLWAAVDQAPCMDMVIEAFKAVPVKKKEKFARELLDAIESNVTSGILIGKELEKLKQEAHDMLDK